jgi:hypothetical protein
MTQSIKSYKEAVVFHGHACPGLALGYRAAEYALQIFRAGRSEDEDLVAIVENDACGVDAIQVVAGCGDRQGSDNAYRRTVHYPGRQAGDSGEGKDLHVSPVCQLRRDGYRAPGDSP